MILLAESPDITPITDLVATWIHIGRSTSAVSMYCTLTREMKAKAPIEPTSAGEPRKTSS